MKNLAKLFGIIALVAVIGFSMIACDNGTTSRGPSLNGSWQLSSTGGLIVVNINGSTGTITQIPSNIFYISVGNTYFRNLSQTGNLTWTGQELGGNYTTGATGWTNTTITLNSNGRSFYSSAYGYTFTKR